MSPEEIREHATTLILDHARDVERLSIAEHLSDNYDGDYSSDDVTAIRDLIDKAMVTVEFPASGDTQPTPVGQPPARVRCAHGTVWEYRTGGYCHPGSPNPSYYTVAELERTHGPVTVVASGDTQ